MPAKPPIVNNNTEPRIEPAQQDMNKKRNEIIECSYRFNHRDYEHIHKILIVNEKTHLGSYLNDSFYIDIDKLENDVVEEIHNYCVCRAKNMQNELI